MRIVGKFIFWFFVILVSFNLVLFSFSYINFEKLGAFSDVVSPLPKLLTNVIYNDSDSSFFWQPKLGVLGTAQKPLDLTAKAALSYDTETNTMLYEKNIDDKLPIASLTKIMTAVIALENMSMEQDITITKSAATIGEDSMGLSEGEKLRLTDLMYGMLLQSGNDAAEAIAQASKFKRNDYIHLMNKKAEDLGLSNTRFTNPTGLQGDGEQYSTAKEMLVLANYALKKKLFAEIVATYEYNIDVSPTHKGYTLFNETNLLTTYPGVKGVKTGFTDEAGLCLVTYLDYKEHKIIAILLNSQNRRAEMAEILDYSLMSLGVIPPPHN